MSKTTQHAENYNSDEEVDDIDNNAGDRDGADTLKPATKKQKTKKTPTPSPADLMIKKKTLEVQRRIIVHKEKTIEARMSALSAAKHRNDASMMQIDMALNP